MHIHKSLHWLGWGAGMLIIFFSGFYIGTLDASENTVRITSQCTGFGVSKSFSSSYESVNGQVVRDESKNSETYTARCLCFASDASHKNVWVDTVEIAGDSAESVRTTCNNDCQTLCEGRLVGFTFAE